MSGWWPTRSRSRHRTSSFRPTRGDGFRKFGLGDWGRARARSMVRAGQAGREDSRYGVKRMALVVLTLAVVLYECCTPIMPVESSRPTVALLPEVSTSVVGVSVQ